jgi:hypothetical protein
MAEIRYKMTQKGTKNAIKMGTFEYRISIVLLSLPEMYPWIRIFKKKTVSHVPQYGYSV